MIQAWKVTLNSLQIYVIRYILYNVIQMKIMYQTSCYLAVVESRITTWGMGCFQ